MNLDFFYIPAIYSIFMMLHHITLNYIILGELKSSVQDLCVTAGWPFLTGVSFVNPEGETVVVS